MKQMDLTGRSSMNDPIDVALRHVTDALEELRNVTSVSYKFCARDGKEVAVLVPSKTTLEYFRGEPVVTFNFVRELKSDHDMIEGLHPVQSMEELSELAKEGGTILLGPKEQASDMTPEQLESLRRFINS